MPYASAVGTKDKSKLVSSGEWDEEKFKELIDKKIAASSSPRVSFSNGTGGGGRRNIITIIA